MEPTDWWRAQVFKVAQAKSRGASPSRGERITPEMIKQQMHNVDDLSSLALTINDEEVHVFF